MRTLTFMVCLLVGLSVCQAWPWDRNASPAKSANTAGPIISVDPLNSDIKTITLVRENSAQTLGFSVSNVKRSLLVSKVTPGSPAAKVGLKFGDQVLTVNNETPMGRPLSQLHDWMSRLESVTLTYKPAPHIKRFTMQRDPIQKIFGFEIDDNGEIDVIYVNTPAVRVGLMTDHMVLSVNGHKTDGKGTAVIDETIKTGDQIVLETMPSNIYFPIVNTDMSESEDDALMQDTQAS